MDTLFIKKTSGISKASSGVNLTMKIYRRPLTSVADSNIQIYRVTCHFQIDPGSSWSNLCLLTFRKAACCTADLQKRNRRWVTKC